MVSLDDLNAIKELQGGDGVIVSVDALPKQLSQSFTEAQALSIPENYRGAKSVLVCGMGGSRFPTLIIRELYKTLLKLPIEINDDYQLPGYVGPETLVLLSSYSGTTEEVMACAKTAKEKGAMLLGISSGGEIETTLKALGAPVYVFDPVNNPSGQPRIGFGYGVGGQLGLFMNLGFIDTSVAEVEEAIAALPELIKPFGTEFGEDQNEAKQMAKTLFNKYPYYTVGEHLIGVGNALQNQTNETAKSISSYRVIPELNHHLMEGLKFPTAHGQMATFVFFESDLYSDRIQKRFAITKDVVVQNNVGVANYKLRGATKVAQVFELMGFAAYLTMYMSVLYEQDPALIPYVDYFKEQLKK